MEKKQSKVRVVIRVRPPLQDKDKTSVTTEDNHVTIFNHRNTKENIQYEWELFF